MCEHGVGVAAVASVAHAAAATTDKSNKQTYLLRKVIPRHTQRRWFTLLGRAGQRIKCDERGEA